MKIDSLPFDISRKQPTPGPPLSPRSDSRPQVRADRACRGQVSAAQTVFFMIFGRTDLRMGVSGAKFDAEVDFEVHFTPAP